VKLSVIIVNYNVCYFLEQCLHSVFKACKGIDAEVIVVDNNSVDGSLAMLHEKFPDVVLIDNKRNTGFSFANNQAMRISKGEYVLLLNPDTVVEEDTFSSIISFMDAHPEGGGLGVKMIDGKGKFLPESKRGLPTPEVAFYKIFGLSLIFPKSKIFGRYHLGFLDNDHVHEIEILSGAFMFMRRSVLDEVGLLDEDFFMYGEDIDLSYRITKAGYKNYYFPFTRIIHYKGESTKKSSINYVFVFYRAMIIFARKHFSQQNANLFSFFINLAIYLRAAVAIASRFTGRMLLPVIDALVLFAGMSGLSKFWEKQIQWRSGGDFDPVFLKKMVPVYILIWLVSVLFSGGYDKPIKIWKIIRGVSVGTVFIYLLYFFLPSDLHFSRALIALGAGLSVLTLTVIRYALHLMGLHGYELNKALNKRFLVIGSKDECARVSRLLEKTSVIPGFIGLLSHAEEPADKRFFIGNISELKECIEVNKVDELIFCARDVSAQRIINLMEELVVTDVDFKIAPPRSLYLIGSNSSEGSGDLYIIDMNSITSPSNKRNKRLLDLGVAFLLLLSFPVSALKMKSPLLYLKNIFFVLLGWKSWVGYAKQEVPVGYSYKPLPQIRPGILNPGDGEPMGSVNPELINKLNLLYSKDYTLSHDWSIIRKGFVFLGKRR
jgi:GT2 family glycosyltransferase